jgi:tetratricopeptide (TPR) repeat protein
MRHVTDADMEHLLSGRLGPGETRSLFRHLLSRCRFCRRHWALIAEVLEEEDGAPGPDTAFDDSRYDAAIDRAFAAAQAMLPHWQVEAGRVNQNLAEAAQHPRGVLDLPKDTPDEYSWSWVETLLRAVPAERYRDPQHMLMLALGTEAQARRLRESGLYPTALAADLHARALGELANSYRITNQFTEADALLNKAVTAQQEGTGDPLVLARLWEIGSSVRLAQRQLDIAIEALDGACQLYNEVGEPHLAGRALIKKGICTAHTCRYAEAAEILQEGLDRVDAVRDPHLATIGQYCYVYSLADCGEYIRASELLLKSGLREAFAAEPLNLLKLRWLEGKIHAGLGRLEKAETALTAARQGFFQKIQNYDAALVGLDLLEVWLRQGKAVEAQELAEDVLETFLDLGIQSEALKALRYLREACRQRAATPALVKLVADFLRQLEWQPLLRFAPAPGL